jgi:hypothetical protein
MFHGFSISIIFGVILFCFMEKKIADMILEELSVPEGSSDVFLGVGEQGSLPAKFDASLFEDIPFADSSGKCVSSIAFVDGGNAEIMSSPGFCLHLCRVFSTVYSGKKRVGSSLDEFYVLCLARVRGQKILYECKVFPSRSSRLDQSFFSKDFVFDAFDKSIAEGFSRAKLSKVAGVIMSVAEKSVARSLVMEKCIADFVIDGVVLDGDFGGSIVDYEKEAIASLDSASKGSGMIVCALSKTSDMLSSAGVSVSARLSASKCSGNWYYPIASSDFFSQGFVRLHPKSDYVFKLDALCSKDCIVGFLPKLAYLCSDPVFLGYPYGLVEADQFARVSNSERNSLLAGFMARAGNDWKSIESALRSSNAHSVLDRIRF